MLQKQKTQKEKTAFATPFAIAFLCTFVHFYAFIASWKFVRPIRIFYHFRKNRLQKSTVLEWILSKIDVEFQLIRNFYY